MGTLRRNSPCSATLLVLQALRERAVRSAVALGACLAIIVSMASADARELWVPPGLVTSADTHSRIVALTFDDGPSRFTGRILAELNRYHVSATFFVTGKQVRSFSGVVRSEARAGNEIGNRTFDNRDLQSLSTPGIVAEMARSDAMIVHATHVTPDWFRPPYGDVDSRIVKIAASLGLRSVTWSVDPHDYENPGASAIVDDVLRSIQPGSIVILHDGGGNRRQTVAALPAIIQRLKLKGYRFATLDQLFGLAPLPACVPGSAREFGSSGYKVFAAHPIYRYWAALLCRGINLGPATSSEFPLKHGIVAQDFRYTGHRLKVSQGGHVTSQIVWSWAKRAFSTQHVPPLDGQPITRAWFARFFVGHTVGPALAQEKPVGTYVVQQFQSAWAIESSYGQVRWEKHVDLSRLRS